MSFEGFNRQDPTLNSFMSRPSLGPSSPFSAKTHLPNQTLTPPWPDGPQQLHHQLRFHVLRDVPRHGAELLLLVGLPLITPLTLVPPFPLPPYAPRQLLSRVPRRHIRVGPHPHRERESMLRCGGAHLAIPPGGRNAALFRCGNAVGDAALPSDTSLRRGKCVCCSHSLQPKLPLP